MHLWLERDPVGNDLRFLDRVKGVLAPGTLVVMDAANATICMRQAAADDAEAERMEEELRLRAHRILRTAGAYG